MTTILFLDDLLVAQRRDTVRRLGRPRWVPEATLDDILCDGTWNRPTVFPLPEGGYRALYNGVTYEDGRRVPLGLMVAESRDGVSWSKPDLSARVPLPDRRLPNQVYTMHYGGPVFHDPADPDPDRRLKVLHSTGSVVPGETGLFLGTSPDGLSWRREREWGDQPLDAPISIFRDRRRSSYVISKRPIKHDRRVAFVETPDFRRFSEPRIVLSPDPEDPPLAEFYGMTVFPYEDCYIGLLKMFHVQPDELHKRRGYADGWLAYSYDGWHFNRLFHRPFLPRNERGQPGGGGIYPSCLVVPAEGEMLIYSGGSRAGHFHLREPLDSALMLHTLRRDGFAHLEPAGLTGRVMTRPLRLQSAEPRLELNVRAPHGHVRAQLLDRDGVPLPGRGFDDCAGFTGDDVRHAPRWTEEAALPPGTEVHLEIELTNAELYAVRGDFSALIGHGAWPG